MPPPDRHLTLHAPPAPGRAVAAILLALLSAAFPAAADDRAALADPAVALVASAAWPRGEAGSARVLVLSRGWEHVSSEVHAQWLAPDEADERSLRVASSRMLLAPGLQLIDHAELDTAGDRLRVTLSGRMTYEPGTSVRCVFELDAGGDVHAVVPCTGS